MPHPLSAPGLLRFGPFEFEPKSGQLRSEGSTLRLADQPLALLNALLERPGEMVSREDLRHRLWPDGTFVDFEHGLNSAVSRLREALNDSATTPRFVETIPRRGYRLLVPVEFNDRAVVDDVARAEPLPAGEAAAHAAPSSVREPRDDMAVEPFGCLVCRGGDQRVPGLRRGGASVSTRRQPGAAAGERRHRSSSRMADSE